jgi:hypothetical protein
MALEELAHFILCGDASSGGVQTLILQESLACQLLNSQEAWSMKHCVGGIRI